MTLKDTLTGPHFDPTTVTSVLIEGDTWHQIKGSDFALNGDVITFTPVLSPEMEKQLGCCGTVRMGVDRLVALHTVPKA